MCRICCEGEVPWSLRNAQCAAKYHTKLLLRVLERLDLPLTHLQELRLAATRTNRRRVARLPNSGQWRSSPWGALYLSLETRCPVWQHLSDAVSHGQDADSKVERPCPAAFTSSCMSSSEADLIQEAETHLCAALRHLSAVAGAIAAVKSSRESGGFHDMELRPTIDSAKLISECSDIDAVSLAFDRSLKELLDVAWPFFLRTQLSNALLEGDVIRAAAWAVQFLGVAEPWGLRRVQELTSLGLELAAEHLSVRSSSAIQDAGNDCDAWNLLRGACAAYLTVPIIPRFEARLRRTVSRLVELGLSRPLEHGQESCGRSALARSLDAMLKPEQQPASSREFDASGAALGSFRDADNLHAAFREALSKAAREHLDGTCKLEVRKAALAGIEAICSLEVGGAMQKSRRLQLEEAVASVLEEPVYRRVARPQPSEERPLQSPTQPLIGESEWTREDVAATISSTLKQLTEESESTEMRDETRMEEAPAEDTMTTPLCNARGGDEDGEKIAESGSPERCPGGGRERSSSATGGRESHARGDSEVRGSGERERSSSATGGRESRRRGDSEVRGGGRERSSSATGGRESRRRVDSEVRGSGEGGRERSSSATGGRESRRRGDNEVRGADVSFQPPATAATIATVAAGNAKLHVPLRPPSHLLSMPSPPREVMRSDALKQQERAQLREPKSPLPMPQLRPCPEMLLALQAGKISGIQQCQALPVPSRIDRKISELPMADCSEALLTPSTFAPSLQTPSSSPSSFSEASADESLVHVQYQHLDVEVADQPATKATFAFAPPTRSCTVGGHD